MYLKSHGYNFKKRLYFKANSVDHDEMQHNLGFTLCQNTHLLVTSYKGLANRVDPSEIYFDLCSICPISSGYSINCSLQYVLL